MAGDVTAPYAAYGAALIFLLIAMGISLALLLAPFLLAPKAPDEQKNSAYECGFDPFAPSRFRFPIKFYLISILFIIFDLEFGLLVPWGFSFHKLPDNAFWPAMAFILILTLGFVYEWKKGALEWE